MENDTPKRSEAGDIADDATPPKAQAELASKPGGQFGEAAAEAF